jgi:hypothetical protein
MPFIEGSARHVFAYEVENLAAGADIADRPIWAAPSGGAVITKVGIVPQGASAGVDNANTAVVNVEDGSGNSIVSKTYDTANQPPASGAYGDLGSLSGTHAVLTANEVLRLDVTQGATADLPGFVLLVEWLPIRE